MLRLFLFSLIAASALLRAAPNPTPAVVPALKSWVGGEGVISLAKSPLVVDVAHRAALESVARIWSEELAATGFGEHPVRFADTPGPGDIFLTLDAKIGNAEGYAITLAAGSPAVLSGKTAAGVFYATRTLHQIFSASDKAGCLAPCGEIRDEPTTRGRMFMLDVGRKPTPIPVLRDYLRTMAYYKFNEFHIHFSDEALRGAYAAFRIQSDTYPGLAAKDLSYSKAELRELQDFAKCRGITITPEIDMPGHSACFTRYWPDLLLRTSDGKTYPRYMDVANPATAERMKRLLNEMIPVFDAPDFHIGTDEYRVEGKDREKLHEAFREFINTMNVHVRSLGKNTRIWSGFEHMAGATEIDPSVTIDMWETDDAKARIARGHKVINSHHGRTYIVPGAHYYGINPPAIYTRWEPFMVSENPAKNPSPDDPALLGAKLHVWCDQGPTGWTHTEIAQVSRDGLQVFGEKLWGARGSPDYADFRARADRLSDIPSTSVYERPLGTLIGLPGTTELSTSEEFELTTPETTLPLPWAERFVEKNLPWPWTLSFEVMKTAETGKRGVILSSDLVEIVDGQTLAREEKVTDKASGKTVRRRVEHTGFALVRAAGPCAQQGVPATSGYVADVSAVVAPSLPLDRWVKVTVSGYADKTVVDIDGKRAGVSPNRTVCPLATLGSPCGESLVGKIRNITIRDSADRNPTP